MMSSAPTCSSLVVPNKVYKGASAQWRSMAGQAPATCNNSRPGTLPKRAANKTSRISQPSRRQPLVRVLVPVRSRQSQTLCLKAWRHLPVWNASREQCTISMLRSILICSLPRKPRKCKMREIRLLCSTSRLRRRSRRRLSLRPPARCSQVSAWTPRRPRRSSRERKKARMAWTILERRMEMILIMSEKWHPNSLNTHPHSTSCRANHLTCVKAAWNLQTTAPTRMRVALLASKRINLLLSLPLRWGWKKMIHTTSAGWQGYHCGPTCSQAQATTAAMEAACLRQILIKRYTPTETSKLITIHHHQAQWANLSVKIWQLRTSLSKRRLQRK